MYLGIGQQIKAFLVYNHYLIRNVEEDNIIDFSSWADQCLLNGENGNLQCLVAIQRLRRDEYKSQAGENTKANKSSEEERKEAIQ